MDKGFLIEILLMYRDGEQTLDSVLEAIDEYSIESNGNKEAYASTKEPVREEDGWIDCDENNLPEPKVLCWIERNNGEVYFGYRMNKPFSSYPNDLSKDCYWQGNPTKEQLRVDPFDWHPYNHFSDFTVKKWKYVKPPKQLK